MSVYFLIEYCISNFVESCQCWNCYRVLCHCLFDGFKATFVRTLWLSSNFFTWFVVRRAVSIHVFHLRCVSPCTISVFCHRLLVSMIHFWKTVSMIHFWKTVSVIHLWKTVSMIHLWKTVPVERVSRIRIRKCSQIWPAMAQSVYGLSKSWTVQGSNACGGVSFLTRSDRPWGPFSPLYNGYRVSSPGVKRPGRGGKHPSHVSPRLKKE